MTNYAVSGKTITLKLYADVHDTIAAIKRIVKENYPAVKQLAYNLQGKNCDQTFLNIWNFVRHNIKYKNDDPGREQLRTPQRTLHDRIGDCDDMTILISALLINLNIKHELWITAYKQSNKWQHIYPVAFSSRGERYVIDCVPEIPYFNYEAKPIKNKIIINMRLEELGEAIPTDMISELLQPFNIDALAGFFSIDDELETLQGLLGNIAIVDEFDEYDTILSGTQIQRNIVLKQLLDAKYALEREISNPTDMSDLNNNSLDLKLINDIIHNYNDDQACSLAVENAIKQGTIYQNFYKTIQYGLFDILDGLSGEDEEDMYYLKVMDEQGMFDDYVDGLGLFKKLKSKIKKNVQNFKEKNPKLAKVGHSLKKYNPATFTLRRAMEPFLRANVYQMAEKLAIGYASEEEARKLGYSTADWKEFVAAKDQAEQRWHSLGGDKAYFKKMVMDSGAKKAGLRGDLGASSSIIATVTKAFGKIIDLIKKLRLRKRDGSLKEQPAESRASAIDKNIYNSTNNYNEDENMETDEKSGVTTETITDENGKQKKLYRDKNGNEISRFKAFFLKHKTMIIIVAIVLTVGITGLIIWKMRRRGLRGLEGTGLSKKQENFIKRQGLNNRAYASLVREEIKRDKKPYNDNNRKGYYKKIFRDAFSRPLSTKQVTAAHGYNRMYHDVRKLAKAKGGGSKAWRDAWAEVKKKA